jgi:hypothetical protein
MTSGGYTSITASKENKWRGKINTGMFDWIACDSCAFMTCEDCPIDLGGDLDDPDYDDGE